jgi:MFS family permease
MDQHVYDAVESNIWKIAVSDILFGFGLIQAIYILFFQVLGFRFNEIGLFEAVTSVVIITTELPTGVLADFAGRKWTVFSANVFMLMFALLLGFSSGSLFVIILAGIFNGLEFSLKSGARTALLYDTLKVLKREDEFLKISGRINAVSTVSGITGMIVGAFLFTVNPRLPYWLWAVCIGVSIFVIARMCEPLTFKNRYDMKTYVTDMKNSVLFIFRTKKLLWISVFFFVASICAESYWDVYSQAHMKSVGLNPSGFGIIFAVCAGANAFASYYVDDIEKRLGEKRSLYIIILIEAIVFGVMASCKSGIALIFLLIIFTTNRKFAELLEEYYKNKLIPSAQRAGILSAGSVLYNGLFGGGVIIWLFGGSLDVLGGGKTLIISSLSVFAVGIALLQVRYSRTG